MEVVISLSNTLLSQSLKEYLKTSHLQNFSTSVGKPGKKYFSADMVITDIKTLCSNSFIKCYPNATYILIDTGLSMQEKRAAVISKGVRGIVPKESSSEMFCETIISMSRGEISLDRETMQGLITYYHHGSGKKKLRQLTNREREILALVCRGYCNKDIAKDLGICVPTVKAFMSNIFKKFNVSSRSELQAVAFSNGLTGMTGIDL